MTQNTKKLIKAYHSHKKTKKYEQDGIILFEKILCYQEAFKQYVGNGVQNYFAGLLGKEPFAPNEEIICQQDGQILLKSYELMGDLKLFMSLLEKSAK